MKTLLVLEDEIFLMKLLRHMLKQYNLIEATTAEEALRLFEALLLFGDHGQPIDLLVADVTLPTMSGIEVAVFLRSRIPDLPVLLTSGYPVDGWSQRHSAALEKLGSESVSILQKPFQAQMLLTAVRELLGEPQTVMASTA